MFRSAALTENPQFKELEAKINLISCMINKHDIVSSQESTIKSLLRTINAQTTHNQQSENEERFEKHNVNSGDATQEYSTARPTNERPANEQPHTKKAFQQWERKTAVEDDYSPQTTNDVNVDSVETTRNGQRTTTTPLHNNQRSVTSLSFPKYEDGDDYVSWTVRNLRPTARHSSSEAAVNAPQPRPISLPISDIDDPTTFLSSRMRATPSEHSHEDYDQPDRRDQQIQASDYDGRFDPTSRPTLQISIPKGPTFYSLSIGERYSNQPSPYDNTDRPSDTRSSPSRAKNSCDSSECSHTTGGNRYRGNPFWPVPEDELDEDEVQGRSSQEKNKKRVRVKGKARAPSPSYFFGPSDVSLANPEPSGARNAPSSSRPNLSRYSSFSSIALLKTPDPKSGTIPTLHLLGGPVYDSPLPFPLHPVPKHPPQSYDPVLSSFDSDYAFDTPEQREVRLYQQSMFERPRSSDEQYHRYQLSGSLENSPAREVPIDIKDNRRTPATRSDRTLSTLHIPSPYSSPRPTERQQYRPDRRLRPSTSKLNISMLNTHDGYLSSEESSTGWVSSATAVQVSPRRRLPPTDDDESPSSAHSYHVHFSESTRDVSPSDEQELAPVPPEPCTPPDRYNNATNASQVVPTTAAEKGKLVSATPVLSPVLSPSSHSSASSSRRAELRPAKPIVTEEQSPLPSPAPVFSGLDKEDQRGQDSPVVRDKVQPGPQVPSKPPVFSRS
ncbi:hypothetical protein BJ165DRAFT_1528806 [Panaeolus papilionaceus]|nr:hypothetical protein BJ165DRAFT_1528806 [Panaeolus papilionaceus]